MVVTNRRPNADTPARWDATPARWDATLARDFGDHGGFGGGND